MYVQRVCRENCAVEIKEETSNSGLTKNLMEIVLEAIDAVTRLGLF
jgi:hypothetical protein